MVSSSFPPCTALECSVDEEEKRQASTGTSREPCAMTEKCVSACAAYGRVCPCAARIASNEAREAIEDLKKNSKIFCQDECQFPHIDSEHIKIFEKIGEGGFSNVNRCVVEEDGNGKQEYAVKYLKRKVMVELRQFKHGAADLANEAFFLNALDHENIIKLHGVSAGSIENNVASGRECGFFIVVDRLGQTLEQRIASYRLERGEIPPRARRGQAYRDKCKADLSTRVGIAISIAKAMSYLHEKGLIYRDLKPDNIGFDHEEKVKLFDFGLAKELKPELNAKAEGYLLTGNTGSRRYMAPEVARDLPYGQPVDVYSFGILLWELLTAEKPFFGYSSGKHLQLVVNGGERPSMDTSRTGHWPMNLQWLITRCWAATVSARPTFKVVLEILGDVLDAKEDLPESLKMELREPMTPPPTGGFGSLFSKRSNRRAATTGKIGTPKGGPRNPWSLSARKK